MISATQVLDGGAEVLTYSADGSGLCYGPPKDKDKGKDKVCVIHVCGM